MEVLIIKKYNTTIIYQNLKNQLINNLYGIYYSIKIPILHTYCSIKMFFGTDILACNYIFNIKIMSAVLNLVKVTNKNIRTTSFDWCLLHSSLTIACHSKSTVEIQEFLRYHTNFCVKMFWRILQFNLKITTS